MASSLHQRLVRFLDYTYLQFSYLVVSRFKGVRLRIPGGYSKGVVLSLDVETWEDRCGGYVEPSADPQGEYFKYLPGLLDLFEDYSISAQFFVCGKVLQLYPQAFREVVRKGHNIGGHGFAHERMSTLSNERQKDVIQKVKSLMHEKYDLDLKTWRCPGLAANRETYRAMNECGVKLCSNASWGKPMFIDGVLEVPMARKMDGQILGYSGLSEHHKARNWAEYMKSKFGSVRKGIVVFGMHTWLQSERDPKYEALTHFLDFLRYHRDKVWVGGLDDLEEMQYSKETCL